MMTSRSHGDGRRMTVDEAVRRRARIIRVHGSLDGIAYRSDQDRRWAAVNCQAILHVEDDGEIFRCLNDALGAEDVDRLYGIPVAMCARCRGAR